MKLNFIKKSILLLAFSLAIVSCETDDQTGESQSTVANTTANISLEFANPVIFYEANGDMTYDYTVTLSEIQIVDIKLYIAQVGGTADDHDLEMTSSIVIPAGYTTGNGSITVFADEEIEGDETAVIQIGDVRTANAAMTPVTVNINIVDYVFCTWNLEGVDTYGDGWNGAAIRLTADGVETDYSVEGGSGQWDVAVPVGANYSFEFVSGAWDGEIEYTLTGPDGTAYADAYYPAIGVITSGVSACD